MGERLYQQIGADGDTERVKQLVRGGPGSVILVVSTVSGRTRTPLAYAQCPDGNMRQYAKTLPPVDGRVFISLSAFGCDHLV